MRLRDVLAMSRSATGSREVRRQQHGVRAAALLRASTQQVQPLPRCQHVVTMRQAFGRLRCRLLRSHRSSIPAFGTATIVRKRALQQDPDRRAGGDGHRDCSCLARRLETPACERLRSKTKGEGGAAERLP